MTGNASCRRNPRKMHMLLATVVAALVLFYCPGVLRVHRRSEAPSGQSASSALAVLPPRRRYDRGHRNWNKHLRELLNHSAAWDYDTAWAPALHAHKVALRAAQLSGHPTQTHSPEPRETPALCKEEKTRAYLQRITPPELTLSRLLRPHATTRAPVMKLAYLIFAHNVETLHGAERLVHWLYHRAHTFVFHIDYAAPVAFRCYLENKYRALPNIHLSKQERSAYGSFGIVLAELAALRTAVAVDSEWEMAVPVAGGALPIKPPHSIECFLKQRQQEQLGMARATTVGTSRVDPRSVSIIPTQELPALHPANPKLESNSQRVTNSTVCVDETCERLVGTPGGAHWWKGSQWHMLGRLFVEYALTDEHASEWLDFFASPDFIFASDESWANTIARQSLFNSTTVFDRRFGSTMALWFGPNCRSHRNPREKSSPCYLGNNDWDDLANSSQLFARKFLFNDPVVPRVLEELVNAKVAKDCG